MLGFRLCDCLGLRYYVYAKTWMFVCFVFDTSGLADPAYIIPKWTANPVLGSSLVVSARPSETPAKYLALLE